ncbi:MAG: hypothetical protein E7480_05795 [Ruminococcaceae bacterium]|nr:hypothetical protein [Oscillospiraceae bacterium]
MKKRLSISVALCMLLSIVLTLFVTVAPISAASTNITIINDGTSDLSKLYGGDPKEWLPSGTFGYAPNGGHANSDSYKYENPEFVRISVYDSESYSNWTNVDYIQMYVFNDGTTETYLQIYMKSNAGSYDGFESYCFSPDAVAYLSSDCVDWSREAEFKSEDMYTAATYAGKYGHLIIPAGFKGYIRIPATSETLYNAKEWANDYNNAYSSAFLCENLDFQFHLGANTKLTVDDIALVGEGVGANFPDYTFTMDEYIAGAVIQHSPYAKMPAHTQVLHTALDFESNVTINSSPNDLSLSFERSTDYKATGDYSLKVTDGADETGTSFTSQIRPSAIARENISKAEYFEFWVKNTSSVDYTIVNLKLNNILVDASATEITRFEAEGWLKLKDMVIPAGYEGKFRVGINGNFINVGARSNRLEFSLKEQTGTGGTLYFDDFCFVAEYYPPVKVTMPEGMDRVAVIEDFETGISNIKSGINYIKLDFASTTDFVDEGSKAMKLTTLSQTGGSEPVTQIQFVNGGEANAEGAKYLQFWVKNTSAVEFGVTWVQINGELLNAKLYEISLFKDGDWYLVNKYNKADDIFAIPAGYEGHIRIKIDGSENGYKVKNDYIDKFELAIWEETRTANSVLYIDDFCTVGTPPAPYVKTEVTMPEGMEVVKVVLDAEDVNIKSIGSGINFVPVKFSLYEGFAGEGKYSIEIKNTGESGGSPAISEFQPKDSFLNWTGARYFEFKVTNPTEYDYGISWIKINNIAYNLKNTEISYSENGKWYNAENNNYQNGIKIYPGYEGYIRVKLTGIENEIEDFSVVNGFMFGVYQKNRTEGLAIYVDDFRVIGYMDEHTEPEDNLQPYTEFPVDEVIEKIEKGKTEITCYLLSNGTIPEKVIAAIKGKDINLNVGVFNEAGRTLYQVRLNGLNITEEADYVLGTEIGEVKTDGEALILPVKLPENKNKADIAVNVLGIYPAQSNLFFYKEKGESAVMCEYDRETESTGFVVINESQSGSYFLSDVILDKYDNDIIPQGDITSPDTSDRQGMMAKFYIFSAFLSVISITVILKRRRLVK